MEAIKTLVSNIGEYINIILILFSIIVSIISIIFKIKSNFSSVITQFIKDAEEKSDLTGPEKMDLVISWLKNIIPRIFKVVFSDKVLRQIADNIYNDMKAYREIYINNKTGLATSQVIQIVKKTTEELENEVTEEKIQEEIPEVKEE